MTSQLFLTLLFLESSLPALPSPRQAGALHEYGIHTVGRLAAASPATVQRLSGGRADHQAQLEVTASHGGWRADVLVTATQSRRTALEAQLSCVPVDDVVARTRRYREDDIAAVWFTHRAARWLAHMPAARACTAPWRPTGRGSARIRS